MKKKRRFIVFLFAIISIALILWALKFQSIDFIPFDPAEKGLVHVTTKSDGSPFSEEGVFSYTIADKQRIQPSDAFEPNAMEVFDASSSLYSFIEEGRVVNHISTIIILDENRYSVPVTEEFKDIVSLASQINHDVMTLKIMKTDECTFAYTELNVNWQSPCTLYYYNPEERSLSKLYTWNDEKVTNIKVLNPALLKKLKPTYRLEASE